MPTNNPRVNVTLSPSTDALVRRLSGLQRVSKAQVLRELLEAAEPALQRAASLMEAAQGVSAAVLHDLAMTLDKAQKRAEAQLAVHLAEADSLSSDLVTQAQAVRDRRPGRELGTGALPGRAVRKSGPPSPPASNRGVKSTKRGRPSSNVRVQR